MSSTDAVPITDVELLRGIPGNAPLEVKGTPHLALLPRRFK